MVNNTSRHRWQGAEARHLATPCRMTVEHGLNCSPFEAEAVREAVYEVSGPLLETSDALQPGPLRVSVVDARVPPNTPLARAQQRLVTLTLDAGSEDREVRRGGGVIARRRHRFLRVCEEAFAQGGLLPLEGVADLFTGAVRTLVDDLAAGRAEGLPPPVRSTVKDLGRALTHRTQIVTRGLAGEEDSEIALATHQSVASVAHSVAKYTRGVSLTGAGFPEENIARVARLSPALVRAFPQLHAEAHPVAHRQEELEALGAKKGGPVAPAEGQP